MTYVSLINQYLHCTSGNAVRCEKKIKWPRKCPYFEVLLVLWNVFFSKTKSADSEIDSSLKVSWCLGLPCVICFNMFFFVEKLIWTSEKFIFNFNVFRNFVINV